ncbi:hypothetical protein SOVF_176160 [Spinacia oleracea]|uniref:Kinetochore protein Spc24 n=1 Tax=Spinacia oleracea TaxID=3562 RepID=A0A9R0JJ66_SPIOL|nr:kinetochore protein SPC24 homolog [Spinacia oleracea]KNA06979.1 hypothetical protein SOVF_176160 [Spinacia oleracea]
MGDNSPQFDINQLLSYCNDLVEVLRDDTDFNMLSHCVQLGESIQSSSDSDFNSNQIAISDYQKKIDDCKHKIEMARSEVVSDEEIERLQKELDVQLKREKQLREDLKVIDDDINELDHQRLSLEDRSQRLRKLEEEQDKELSKLQLYASVTKVIPNLDSPADTGHIVDRDKNTVERFEFDPLQEDAFDICNKIWKMIDR